MVAPETPLSQRIRAVVALGFTGAAIGLALVIAAIAGLARNTPTPASRGAVIGFLAFAIVRIAVLALAAIALRARHRRGRALGLAWAALALADSLVAAAMLGAPPLAVGAGALPALLAIAVLLVRPPQEIVFTR